MAAIERAIARFNSVTPLGDGNRLDASIRRFNLRTKIQEYERLSADILDTDEAMQEKEFKAKQIDKKISRLKVQFTSFESLNHTQDRRQKFQFRGLTNI